MNIEPTTTSAYPGVHVGARPLFAASAAVVLRDRFEAPLRAAADEATETTAPDPLLDLIRRRIEVQTEAAQILRAELLKTADGLAGKIDAYIRDEAGSDDEDAIRAAVNRTRLEGVLGLLEESGLGRAEDKYYDALSRLPPLAEKSLGAAGVDDADLALDSEGAKAAIAAYIDADREDFWDAEVAHPSASRILRGLRSSIEAQSLDEAARIIARDEGLSYERAYRSAALNAAEYDRFVNAEAARQADPDGETMLWAYTGPDDGLERPFCDALNGLYFTRAQVGRLDNHQPGTGHPMYSCGGYGPCRHQWTHADAGSLEALGFRRGTDADIEAANMAAAGSR